MTGEEFRNYVMSSRISITQLAKKMGTTPQVISNKYSRQKISSDFLDSVKQAITACHEDYNIHLNAVNSIPAAEESLQSDIAVLKAQNEILRQQNEFLQKLLDRITAKDN